MERNIPKARFARNDAQHVFGLAIAFRIIVDEMHGAAMHNRIEAHAMSRFTARLHLFHKKRNHFVKAQTAATELCCLFRKARAEHAFERAHQAA